MVKRCAERLANTSKTCLLRRRRQPSTEFRAILYSVALAVFSFLINIISSGLPIRLNTQQITGIIPVSPHTVIRYQKESPNFPQPERIGRTNYFDQSHFFEWLNSRATCNGDAVEAGTIRTTDKLIDTSGTCSSLNRSDAWVWLNVTKNPELTLVDLSPSGASRNPRRYFIEREIRAAFPELIELVEVNQ